VAAGGHILLKGRAMVRVYGVVVNMFCLHKWAGWVCQFDSGWCKFFFCHPQPLRRDTRPCKYFLQTPLCSNNGLKHIKMGI
jgi:hypothetical protein